MHIKLCKSTAMYKFLKPLNLDGCHLEQFWRVISSEKPGDRGTWTCDLFTKLPPGQVYVQCLRFLTDCRILSSRREENFGQIIFSLFCGLEIERELMTWCPLFELSGNSRKKKFFNEQTLGKRFRHQTEKMFVQIWYYVNVPTHLRPNQATYWPCNGRLTPINTSLRGCTYLCH
jgi:hypothetical protein